MKISEFIFATDKEIHDVLSSSKKRITDMVLETLLRDRKIFVSSQMDREGLCDYLSILPHDLNDVEGLLDRCETASRAEKTTFVELEGKFKASDIREALEAYQKSVGDTESVGIPPERASSVISTVRYNEFDYSKTRLLQRQERSATLDFSIEDERVILRLPANEKAQRIVEQLVKLLPGDKVGAAQPISIRDLSTENKTAFFSRLIRELPGYRFETVTNIRVAAGEAAIPGDLEADELEEDDLKDIESKLLVVVRGVALQGEGLVASEQYKQLMSDGFFVTSITWRCEQLAEPRDMIQFEAGFEEDGEAFSYGVRFSPRLTRGDGEHSRYFKAVPDARKRGMFHVLETIARKVLNELRNPSHGAK